MADELLINGTPWWRNVNMAMIEDARSRSQVNASRPTTPPPAPVPPVAHTASASPPSAPPVADLSYIPGPRTTLAPEDTVKGADYPNVEQPEPPRWYNDIPHGTLQRTPRPLPEVDEHLNKITSGIKNCINAIERKTAPSPADFEKINDGIHRAFFLDLNATTIRKRRLLHNDTGLPRVFCSTLSGGVEYPWYLKEDAAELYIKWWSRDTNPGLFRGIRLGRQKNVRLGREGAVDKFFPNYTGRRHGDFHGNGPLRNGQWWPSQLCAMRDGAHNATVAGICGNSIGAFSCVMSGGSYPNIDRGEEVWYYGTESEDPTRPTDSTQYMINSSRSHEPVRLLRASKMTTEGSNDFRPAEGLRYDGVYEVVGYEIKNVAKQVHLFHLVRLPGQTPIRSSGPGVRPTPEELEALAKIKIEKKYLA